MKIKCAECGVYKKTENFNTRRRRSGRYTFHIVCTDCEKKLSFEKRKNRQASRQDGPSVDTPLKVAG